MEFKVDLSAPLSDDEHTAQDGPYNRVLKARKWLLSVSAIAVLHHYKLIHYPVISTLTKGLVEITDWLMTNSFKAALSVVWMQFLFLTIQLSVSYRTTITTRLLKNSAEAFDREQERIKASSSAKALAEDALRTLDSQITTIESQISASERQIYNQSKSNDTSINDKYTIDTKVFFDESKAQSRLSALRIQLEGISKQREKASDTLKSIEQQRKDAATALAARVASTPERNPMYWVAEIGIDLLRVAAPFAAATIALWVTFVTPR